jgi:hypothetical protein
MAVIYTLVRADDRLVEASDGLGDVIGGFVEATGELVNANGGFVGEFNRLVNEVVAAVYEIEVLGAWVGMLVRAVDEQGRLSCELGDERRERVRKIGALENDAVARVDWIVVSQNVTREVVKTNHVLVKVMGGPLTSIPDGLNPA